MTIRHAIEKKTNASSRNAILAALANIKLFQDRCVASQLFTFPWKPNAPVALVAARIVSSNRTLVSLLIGCENVYLMAAVMVAEPYGRFGVNHALV